MKIKQFSQTSLNIVIIFVLFLSAHAEEIIDQRSGQLSLSTTDIILQAGPININVTRIFKNWKGESGLLGSNWRLNWERHLYHIDQYVVVQDATGAVVFSKDSTKTELKTTSGEQLIFDKNGNGIRSKPDGTKEIFDEKGRLIECDYLNGNKVLLHYGTDGRLSRIDGPRGSYLQFITDKSGKLTQIDTSSGNSIKYNYFKDTLAEVHINGESIVRYDYDNSGVLIGIDYPQTGPVHFIYDKKGRVINRSWADGSKERFEYDDSTNRILHIDPTGAITSVLKSKDNRREEVTDPLGRKTVTVYDDNGRPLKITDPAGSTTSLEYDTLGRIQKITAPNGYVTLFEYLGKSKLTTALIGHDSFKRTFRYDNHMNLIEIKGGDRIITQMTYSPDGLLKTYKEEGGVKRAFEYYPSGYIKSITDITGERTHFEYDRMGNIIRVVNAIGDVTLLDYDAIGRLKSITDSAGQTTRYEYSPAGQLLRFKSPSGGITEYNYDSRGRVISVKDPSGGITRYEYDPNSRLIAITDAKNHVTRFEYDASGNLVQETNPSGGITKWSYDALNRLNSLTLPSGWTIRYEYDSQGRIARKISSDGEIETYHYDAKDNLVELNQASDAKWTFTYDKAGRLTHESGPLGHKRSMSYDAEGRIVEVQDALERKTQYLYDGFGRMTAIKDPAGRTSRFQYDNYGRISAIVDPAGRQVSVSFDKNGRLNAMVRGKNPLLKFDYLHGKVSKVRGPGGESLSYSYDNLGRYNGHGYTNGEGFQYKYNSLNQITEGKDALGRIWNAEYSSLGGLNSITAPDGIRTRYYYTAFGQIEKIEDAMGRKRFFRYDTNGRVTNLIDALGRTTEIEYGIGSKIKSLKQPDGQNITMHYDLLDRLKEIKYPGGPPALFSYDEAGNLVREEQGKYTADYRYDILDRLIESRYQPTNRIVQYKYDEAGRRSSMEVDGVGRWSYEYDSNDRLINLHDPLGNHATFEYDDSGRIIHQRFSNGISVKRAYDGRGRIIKISVHNRSNESILDRQYEYDMGGNLIKEVREGGAVITYVYDAEDRLIKVNGTEIKENITYDTVGNRLLPDGKVQYDEANQLKHFRDEVFTYDDLGRMVRRQKGNQAVEYIYDSAGRMGMVKRNGTIIAEYGYDTQGRRSWKKVNGKTTYYVYDGLHVLLELDESYRPFRTWTLGPELDRPISFLQDRVTYYPVGDLIGSVVAMSNQSGSVLYRWDYEPFGELFPGADKSKIGEVTPHGFTGREYDIETGLYYFRARYYDPTLGRFLTPDPVMGQLSNPASLHQYQYALNNPLRYSDPLGLAPSDWADAIETGAQQIGYGAGRLAVDALSLPIRAINAFRGEEGQRSNERLNRALPKFREEGGFVGDALASTAASIAADPLRFGQASGETYAKGVDQGKSVSRWEVATTAVTELGRGAGLAGPTASATRGVVRSVTGMAERYGASVLKTPTAIERGYFKNNPKVDAFEKGGEVFLRPGLPPSGTIRSQLLAHEGIHAGITNLAERVGLGQLRADFYKSGLGTFIEESVAFISQSLHAQTRGGLLNTAPQTLSNIFSHVSKEYLKKPLSGAVEIPTILVETWAGIAHNIGSRIPKPVKDIVQLVAVVNENERKNALEEERRRAEAKEKAIQRAIEEARKKAEEEKRKAEEEKLKIAAEEAKRKAEEAKRKIEEELAELKAKVAGIKQKTEEVIDEIKDKIPTDTEVSKLRGSETQTAKLDKSKKKSAKGEKEGIDLAKGINVTDSFDKERSGKSKNESQEAQTGAGTTLSERAGASKSQHEREKGKIDAQGQETDRAISETHKEHTTAQQTAQQERQTSIGTTIAEAVAGGLTSGVATGLDNFFGGVGRGAGQQTSSDIGIVKKSKKGQGPSPSGSNTTAGTGTASQTPPAQGTGSGTKTQDQPGPEVKPDNKDRGGSTGGTTAGSGKEKGGSSGVKSGGTRKATCKCDESSCGCNKPARICSLMDASECKTKTVIKTSPGTGTTTGTKTTGGTSTTSPGTRPGRFSGEKTVKSFP